MRSEADGYPLCLPTFAARRAENLARSMTIRPWVPRPISSVPSTALTRNSM